MKTQSLFFILIISAVLMFLKTNANKNDVFSGASANISIENLKDSVSNSSSLPKNPLSYPVKFSASSAISNSSEIFDDENSKISCAVSISAKAGLAKYIDQNKNTFEFNEKNVLPIASVSKLMTALVAMEKISGDKEIRLSEKAVNTEGIAGEFVVNELFRAKDLIKAALAVSSNDAAAALAESFGEKKFVEAMNKKAEDLNMKNAYFMEPTGLSLLNQSTAVDLAKLVSYIYYNKPEILEITSQKEKNIFDLEKGKFKKLVNTNIFAGNADFIGGKTGFLNEDTGRNLAALFLKNGRVVLTVVLGSENAFEETKKLLTCF
ncbi:D-alanyl-D-alanine carboxypeptidase [Candidatus Wolfebacteria bacterium]|nr:D-alanyl-D-alanine carboxypeptidase [Candidatus Wolfebacteria bacterium]